MTIDKDRRRTVAGLAAGTALVLTGCAGSRERPASLRFAHGVASGDPTETSAVLWTRLSGVTSDTPVSWELAHDRTFRRLAGRGVAAALADRDFTVKVDARGLEAGTRYFYRFRAAGKTSPVGRTRTLPTGTVAALGFAVASCSNYPFGYFNAYEAMALDPEVDFVLHLGDYLYEYAADGWGAEQGASLGRLHRPANETVTLADYRLRHAQYKGDPQSQALHAAHPLIPLWDDHESANNPWTGGAENHQPATEGAWNARRAAATRAWFEWMPVRDPSPGQAPWDYWRSFRFGDLATLVTLETRHGARAQQVEYADHPEALAGPEAAGRFLAEVVGDPARRLLSPEQERFVADALAGSVREEQPWRLVGNQVPMARTAAPRLSEADLASLAPAAPADELERVRGLAERAALGLPLYLDPWDGYPAARERFYAAARAVGAGDLLVLTGDSHSFWANALHDAAGSPMGLELGTAGITSPGDFARLGRDGARLLDRRLVEANPEVLWTDGLHNGYLRLRLTPARAHADYIAVSSVVERDYRLSRLRRLRVGRGESGLAWDWG
ncbi:MAG: alkaline phosphatase D family protein [Pseudohaliea sp.]